MPDTAPSHDGDPRKRSDTADIVSAILGLIGVVVAAVAAWASWSAADSANRTAADSALRQQMIIYLDQYTKIAQEIPEALIPDKYDHLSLANKVRIQILAGQLVGVVELMKKNGDIRFEKWESFIPGLSGPLNDTNGFDLEYYASDPGIRAYIVASRKR